MQIGCCWFDRQRLEVTDPTKNKVWQLQHSEAAVLAKLLDNRDKVVSKACLQASLESVDQSEQSVVQLIQRIKILLGSDSAHLLEKISDQGYMLHSGLTPTSNLNQRPFQTISALFYGIFVLVIFTLMAWIYSETNHSSDIDAFVQQNIATKTQQQVKFGYFALNRKHREEVQPIVKQFIASFYRCEKSAWNYIALSLSDDNKMLSFVLLNNLNSEINQNNIKVPLVAVEEGFLNPAWLVEVGICE